MTIRISCQILLIWKLKRPLLGSLFERVCPLWIFAFFGGSYKVAWRESAGNMVKAEKGCSLEVSSNNEPRRGLFNFQIYNRNGHCFTDFWVAYSVVIPDEQHTAVGKETGETGRAGTLE